MVMWAIWNARNDYVFGKQRVWPCKLIENSQKMVYAFQDVQMKSTVSNCIKNQNQVPPGTGVFKVNFCCAQLQYWGFG